jgi:hypothetical protein
MFGDTSGMAHPQQTIEHIGAQHMETTQSEEGRKFIKQTAWVETGLRENFLAWMESSMKSQFHLLIYFPAKPLVAKTNADQCKNLPLGLWRRKLKSQRYSPALG